MPMNDAQLKLIARVHAQANKSDPFSYGRMLNILRKGLDDPDEILKEAFNIIKSHGEKWSM